MYGVATAEEVSILSSLKNEISRLQSEIDFSSKKIHTNETVPCIEAIELEISQDLNPNNEFTPKKYTGSFVVSQDGPYVATGFHFAVRSLYRNPAIQPGETDFDYSGFWLAMNNMDFYFSYQSTGINRRRQIFHVPSYIYRRSEFGNGFFPLIPHIVFAKKTTISVIIEPIDIMLPDKRADLKLWFGFNGFYILDP